MNSADFELCNDVKATDRPAGRGQPPTPFYFIYRALGMALYLGRSVRTGQLCLIKESQYRARFESPALAEAALNHALSNGHIVAPTFAPEANPASDPEEKDLMKALCQHVVAIAGAFTPVDERGNAVGDDAFFFYSASVGNIYDTWFLITAGHIIDDYRSMIKSGRMTLKIQFLMDNFGEGASFQDRIPFSLSDHKIHHLYIKDKGIDCAMVMLTDNERQLLASNGIKPLGPGHWLVPEDDTIEGYCVVGFPEEVTHTLHTPEGAVGLVKPMLFPIDYLEEDTVFPFPGFHGKAKVVEPFSTVVGMSGGPIFAFVRREDRYSYYSIAVQSSWDSTSRHVYGCLIYEFINSVVYELLNQQLAEKAQ